MFAALDNNFQRDWLIGLLVLWAVFLFGGFIFGQPGNASRRMPTWTRMASSATLVVAAFSWYVFSRGGEVANFALFITIGMTFGFIGDLWLAGWIPGGRKVVAGIIAFGFGHIFYITAILSFAAIAGLIDQEPFRLSLFIWLLIGLIGWYYVVFRGAISRGIKPIVVHRIALPYALLLATTAGTATALAMQDEYFVPLAVGAGLFLLSDLILAGEMFCEMSFRLIGDVIWLTYGPAQMLIVYSIGYAWAYIA